MSWSDGPFCSSNPRLISVIVVIGVARHTDNRLNLFVTVFQACFIEIG